MTLWPGPGIEVSPPDRYCLVTHSVKDKLPLKQTRLVDGNVICRDGGSRTVSSCRRAGQYRTGLAGRQDATVLVSGIPRGSCPPCSFDSHTAHRPAELTHSDAFSCPTPSGPI